MDIKTLVSIGLFFEVIAAGLILMVIWRQWQLFLYHIQRDLVRYRQVLFALALVIFATSLVMIIIDFFTVISVVRRTSSQVSQIGVFYFGLNTGKSFLLAFLVWISYRMAGRAVIGSRNESKTSKNMDVKV